MVHVSIGVTAFGVGMLIPGPFDAMFGALGVLIFKHPIGFAIGVAAYNLAALAVIGVGISGVLDDVGHRRTVLEEQSFRAGEALIDDYCDFLAHPPWWCE